MKGFGLIPYCEVDGVRTLRDSDLLAIWARLEADGIAQRLFSCGAVRDGDEFLTTMKYGENALYLIQNDGDTVGLVWLNGFQERRAKVHGCFFKAFWKSGLSRIGRQVLAALCRTKDRDGRWSLDLLVGQIPADNWLAQEFAEHCGMTPCGQIPAGAYNIHKDRRFDLHLYYYPREASP